MGKMGAAMVRRLMEKEWNVTGYNQEEAETRKLVDEGMRGAYSLKELVQTLEPPRLVWLMVPHTAVESVLEELVPLLEEGDTIIDGGNSPYALSIARADMLLGKSITFLDAGVSGGPSGARNGGCVMVGGDEEVFRRYEELFRDISAPDAYAYFGRSGSGHFVKMVHNGIEYGMMQAIAEGFSLMKRSHFDLDLQEVARVYNKRSVIESRLVGWLYDTYKREGQELENVSGRVSHSGEGQWTVDAAKELGIAVENIEQSLRFREESQENPSYTGKVVSALRNAFGGHKVSIKDN